MMFYLLGTKPFGFFLATKIKDDLIALASRITVGLSLVSGASLSN